MTKIAILTHKNGWHRGNCDYYPIIRWNRELRESGFHFRFVGSHLHPAIPEFDAVLIDLRYYRKTIGQAWATGNKSFVADFMNACRDRKQLVILHDNSDSSGSREFDLITYADKFLKKQVMADREIYNKNLGFKSYMPWTQSANDVPSDNFCPCPKDQLYKIELGWNIGLSDYRRFWFSEYYPIGTSRLLNRWYPDPAFYSPHRDRPLDTVFRGQQRSIPKYSEQRDRVLAKLAQRDSRRCLVGGKVAKGVYLKELRRSKTSVSPFGWGEICFRDFESILAGAILIKPDMTHVQTYPDLFESDVTYQPVRWDLADLDEKLDCVLSNYRQCQAWAENAQEKYARALSDWPRFAAIFRRLLAKT